MVKYSTKPHERDVRVNGDQVYETSDPLSTSGTPYTYDLDKAKKTADKITNDKKGD